MLAAFSLLALVVGVGGGLVLGYFSDFGRGSSADQGAVSSLVSGPVAGAGGTTLPAGTTTATTWPTTGSSGLEGSGHSSWHPTDRHALTTGTSTTSTSRPTTTSRPTSTTRAVRFYEGWPEDGPGYTVMLGAFRDGEVSQGTQGRDVAYRFARRIFADGLVDVGVLYSSDYLCTIQELPEGPFVDLDPDLWVVFSGVYQEYEAAENGLRQLQGPRTLAWYEDVFGQRAVSFWWIVKVTANNSSPAAP